MGHFYFVRHGQTVWNVENKICGCTDSPLTEYGREQARETGRKILAEGIQSNCILPHRADPVRSAIIVNLET